MTLPEFLESSDAIESQMRAEIDRCVAEGNLAEAELRRAEAENRFESLTNELTSHEFENLMLYASIHVAVGIVPPLEAMKALYLIHKEKGPLTWKAVIKEVENRKARVAAEESQKLNQKFVLPMSPQKAAWKEREKHILRESWNRSGMDPLDFEGGNFYMGLPRPKQHLDSRSAMKLEPVDKQSKIPVEADPEFEAASKQSKPIPRPGRPRDPNCDEAVIQRLLVECGFTEAPTATLAWEAFNKRGLLDRLPPGWAVKKFFTVNYGKIKNRLFRKAVDPS